MAIAGLRTSFYITNVSVHNKCKILCQELEVLLNYKRQSNLGLPVDIMSVSAIEPVVKSGLEALQLTIIDQRVEMAG